MFHITNKELVLEEFASKFAENDSQQTIAHYMRTYPEYAQDILEYAGALMMSKHSNEEPFQSEQEREAFVSRARETFRKFSMEAPEESFNGIKTRINELGMEWEDFQSKTGLTKSIVLYMDQKMVDVATIPSKVLKSVSETISVPTLLLRNFFYGGMTPTAAANFKSSSAPIAKEKISFEKAVMDDSELSNDQKNNLLS